MQVPKNAITWFEIPVTNFERARKFYSDIYDYQMPDFQMNHKMGILPYNNQEGIGGAIIQADGYKPSKDGHKIYLQAGEDLSNVLNRVEAAGGKVIQPKMQVAPEIGYIAGIEDTEGNIIYLHSPK